MFMRDRAQNLRKKQVFVAGIAEKKKNNEIQTNRSLGLKSEASLKSLGFLKVSEVFLDFSICGLF